MKKEYSRILIVEVNWLGDVLFSTPLIRAVRENFKDAHIACMVPPRAKEMLEYNPHINEIIIYDEQGIHKSPLGKWQLIKSLRKKRFDLAILLHRSFTRTVMAYLSGIKERAGYVTAKRRFLLTVPVEPPDEPIHKVEYFLKITESLGCGIADRNYEFFIRDAERNYIAGELLKDGIKEGDTLVVMNPGANWIPKRWPPENFAALADILIEKHGVKVALSGAARDIELAEDIKKRMKNGVAILAGKTNMKELAALLERADFVISGDTGPMHIASAMGSSVIALFGPTSPFLTGPHGRGKYRVIQANMEKEPCEIPCYDLACDDYKCMRSITVEDVLWVFEEMYRK